MKKINSVQYEVALGEVITIKVTPVGVGIFIAASLDGHTLSALPNPPATPTYIFTANRPVTRTHFVMMEFSFPSAPNTSKYDVQITGSGGGSGAFTIKKTTAIKDPIIRFKVV